MHAVLCVGVSDVRPRRRGRAPLRLIVLRPSTSLRAHQRVVGGGRVLRGKCSRAYTPGGV
eukprot:6750663-Prymnesium_polylepis.1